METPDFRYDQYPGGEYEQTVDGLTREALDGLRAYLREKQTIVEGEEGENRLIIQTWNSGLLEVNSLTANQLQYLLTGENSIDKPAATPEQNRQEMMRVFEAVVAKYPASAFAALCPRIKELPPTEPQRGFFGFTKKQPEKATQPAKIVTTPFVVNNFAGSITVEYDDATLNTDIITCVTCSYGQGRRISLVFGPDGFAQSFSFCELLQEKGGMPNYNDFSALRTGIAGTADITGTLAVTNTDVVGPRSAFINMQLGYAPEIKFKAAEFGFQTELVPRVARYTADTNEFIVSTKRRKGNRSHTFSAETAAQMLDEILSILPVSPGNVSLIQNPNELR